MCNNLGCKARKDDDFCYSEARTGRKEVTVSNPFDSAKCLNKAVDKLLDDHEDCLPTKEVLMKECTEDGRPLETRALLAVLFDDEVLVKNPKYKQLAAPTEREHC